MARRLIRPRLGDQWGDVLVGGWVHVYEAGTTTEVDVYAAESGGVVLDQPLTTDVRGEVECWADSEGALDFFYSDSGSTTLPSGRRVAFDAFTKTYPANLTLGELADVDADSPAVGQAIAWDGAAYVPTDMGTQIELDAERDARVLADGVLASALSDHSADTTGIHGIADTSVLETTTGAQSKATAAQAAAEATAANASNLTSGTVADARIPSTIARDQEVTDAVAAEALLRANADALLVPLTQKGAVSGVAELDGTGKVPSAQLPSFVDDVVEAANFAALPATGETGKIYVTLNDGLTFRWSGSGYAEISASLALGETSTTAYRGDRGKTAYDHSQITSGNPHAVTKSDVGLGNATNTSDANKPVSTAQQTALDLKAPLASPALTGNPTAPTPTQGDNDTSIATTAYVQTEAGLLVPKSLLDANSVLIAVSDDTPVALAMGASTILARLASGNVVAATPAQLRTLLSLVIGTNVQAWDADLDSIAGLASGADKMPYATAAQTWALTTLTAFARTVLDDPDAATMLATLGAGPALNIQEFSANGTWTKPSGAYTLALVYAIAPGGGGASGRRGAAGTARVGGGAGGSGGVSTGVFAIADLSATETVTVGAAGTAGAAVTADDTNGNNGGDGGVCSFGTRVRCTGGGGGAGGQSGAGGTAGSNGQGTRVGGSGGAGSTSGGAGTTPAAAADTAGGGGGGGVSTSNTAAAGGHGNIGNSNVGNNVANAGAAGASGTAGPAPVGSIPTGGQGGGGGGGGSAGPGGAGAAGTRGCGGGGGAGCVNGFSAQAGGAGGPGGVKVVCV